MSAIRSDRESLGYLSYKAVKEAEARKKAAESGEGTAKTEELTEEQKKTAEEVAAYKKSFLNTIESMVGAPMLSKLEVRVKITDAGYEKMLNDPEYEKAVIDAFRKETLANYDSSAKTITLTADGSTPSAKVTAGTSGTNGLSASASETYANLSPSQLRRGAGLDALNLRVMSVLQVRYGADSDIVADFDQGTLIKGGGTGKASSLLDGYGTKGLLDYTA
ncbi:MAG: hypothetical protein LUE17_10145 [Planctomycetaceae bacterium]|nr:hypothetical protein [Planctomycetaceae bacterium]